MKIRENLYGVPGTDSEQSFEDIIRENEEKIINLIYGMTGDYHLAQDLAQDTFIKAFQAKDTFLGEAKVSTWLYRIAVNNVIDYQRKSSSRKESAADTCQLETPAPVHSSDPDKTCQKNAIRDILFQAVAGLPDQQREVFVLREVNGLSTKEVAEILECSTELVKWRLHKARLALRKVLGKSTKYPKLGSVSLKPTGLE